MRRKEDTQADVAKAAALVKETAEATALALNVSYIQRDIMEIRTDIKGMSGTFVTMADFTEHNKIDGDHESRIRLLEQSQWKLAGMSSLGGAVISTAIAFALKLI